MKSNRIILGMLCLFMSISAYPQRLVLEDAISLTNSYHKDYSQYTNQLEFYKALNAEIKSSIDVLNGYVKLDTNDVECKCYYLKAITKDPKGGGIKVETNTLSQSDSSFSKWVAYYSSELNALDTHIQHLRLTLESYKDVQYSKGKLVNNTLIGYEAAEITNVKNELYKTESKKNQIEIQRGLCYLQFLLKKIPVTDSLNGIVFDMHKNYAEIYRGQSTNFTSFTNYTEKSLFAMTGSAIFNTVIEGFSKFIIDRIKKEAAATATNYYQRLINKIDTNYVNLMEGVFPTTIAMFNNYEAQDINTYIQSIKKAADEDIRNMVPNITNLVVEKKIKVPASIWDGTVLYQTLSESSAPYEFFRNAEKQNFETNLLDSVFDKAYVISELILVRKSNGTLTYASPSYLDNYWNNEFFKKAYIGLGYAQFNSKWKFNADDMKDIIELSSSFYKFSEAALDLSKAKATNDTTFYSKIGYMADCAIDLTEMIKKKLVKTPTDVDKINKVLDAFRFGNQVYKSIYRKNYLTTVNLVLTKLFEYSDSTKGYSEEINYVQAAYEIVKNMPAKRMLKGDLIKALNKQGIYSIEVKEILSIYKDPLDPNKDSVSKADILVYLTVRETMYISKIANQRILYEIASFISSVASVENSDDVKKIFENFALPVGSYSIKRKNAFSITFDAQPGILAGVSGDWKGENKPSFAWGATVPVGFSFSWGINTSQSNLGNKRFRNNQGLNKHSLSIFVPILDLAAPVSFLAGGSSTDTSANNQTGLTSMLKPINIFSPGLFFNYGVPNAPITLFGGFQYNPQIITFDQSSNNEVRTNNGYRFSMGVSVDIPIFRIWTQRNYQVKKRCLQK